jgi:hypothetical protein
LRVVSADSAAAILDAKFNPVQIVASTAVLVEPPYREASARLPEPIFQEAENAYAVVVHEAELCRDLLDKITADVVHLDMTLNAAPLDELSPVELANMKLSTRARQHLLRVLPKIRRIAGEIRRKHDIAMLAIGKESVPVRVAELTTGAHAIMYACEKAIEDKAPVLLGLPTKCQHKIAGNRIYLHSLMAAEHDARGYAECEEELLNKVTVAETLNPCARGFRALKITPKPK